VKSPLLGNSPIGKRPSVGSACTYHVLIFQLSFLVSFSEMVLELLVTSVPGKVSCDNGPMICNDVGFAVSPRPCPGRVDFINFDHLMVPRFEIDALDKYSLYCPIRPEQFAVIKC